ncbi:unnamed protein product [Phytophthora fragariaefolia]|uniref:Splicing factor 3B subunit 4 n=1 Tax=Phytophthora fragariaefolia TaxID=1490495 RepID=A0A9W6WVT2_9STRA|nr:unnamed protein product [Phytophthora fragariaefolia]
MSAAIEQRNQDATVYVGNVDDRVSEELLWELMLQAGSVSNVHMPRDKVTGAHQNYGFVEFRSEECAEYAVKVLNMVQLFGKPLRVKKASSDRKSLDVGANLFLGNLDPEVDEKLLYDTFSAFGGVIETPKIMRDPDTRASRGFGFVSFDSFEAADLAIECMHGQYLCNRQVVVQYAFKKDSRNERHGSEAERLLAQRNPNKLQPHTMFAFAPGAGALGGPPPPPAGYMQPEGVMAMAPPPPPPMAYPPPPPPQRLPPRSGHSAVAVGAEIYVFGGLDVAAGAIYNDVFVFDTRTASWKEAAVQGETPLPRNAHAAIVLAEENESAVARRMLVFGGSSPEYGACGDVYILHIPAHEREDEKKLRWEKLAPSGEIPEARELHCALLRSENTICFTGGRNFDGKVCTDMALLDYESWTWQLVPISGWNCCALAAGVVDGVLISFGGWDGGQICGRCSRYSDEKESWVEVALVHGQQADEPVVSSIPERFGHCGATVTFSKTTEKTRQQGLLIFGGMNAVSDLDDLVLITPDSSSTE